MESQRDWQEHDQCEDLLGKALQRGRVTSPCLTQVVLSEVNKQAGCVQRQVPMCEPGKKAAVLWGLQP
jgi:hypothetical protein